MRPQIHWSGIGEPVLFLPGWNTTAAAVRSWLPASFLAQHHCGVLEWPGLGQASEETLPDSLIDFLDALDQALPQRPVTIVGFCLGGIAAWAFAQRHPGSVRGSVLVESPLYFPLVLAPLLVPGLGWAVLRLAQGTPVGRFLVRRAILGSQTHYPKAFLDSLFGFGAKAALGYLRLFRSYGLSLGSSREAHVSARPCWRLSGQRATRVLTPCWGPRQQIQATPVSLEHAGHFPAVEAPTVFFERLQDLLAGW